jgi:hypothetical protein
MNVTSQITPLRGRCESDLANSYSLRQGPLLGITQDSGHMIKSHRWTCWIETWKTKHTWAPIHLLNTCISQQIRLAVMLPESKARDSRNITKQLVPLTLRLHKEITQSPLWHHVCSYATCCAILEFCLHHAMLPSTWQQYPCYEGERML